MDVLIVGVVVLVLVVIRFWMDKEEWEELGWSVGLLMMDVWIWGFVIGCLLLKVLGR